MNLGLSNSALLPCRRYVHECSSRVSAITMPFQGAGRELLSRSDVFCSPCPAQWNSVHGFKTPKGQLVVLQTSVPFFYFFFLINFIDNDRLMIGREKRHC